MFAIEVSESVRAKCRFLRYRIQLIGGDWYYLREHTGDPLGSCALDTVIDGWRVDASGRWVA